MNIQKSVVVLFLKLVLLEVSIGVIYILLRIGFSYLSPQMDTELLSNPFSLIKSTLFMFVEISIAGFVILQWINNYYIVTLSEIVFITGIISKKEVGYSLKNIQSITVEQDILGRILNYGNIKIFSPALKEDLYLIEISDPKNIVDSIKKILSEKSDKSQFILRR